MFKNLIELYYLAVCLIAMTIIMITTAFSIDNTINYLMPESRYAMNLEKFENNEAYLESFTNETFGRSTNKIMYDNLKNLSETELTAKREVARKTLVQSYKSSAISNLITQFIWLVVALGFYLFHWSKYKKFKHETNLTTLKI